MPTIPLARIYRRHLSFFLTMAATIAICVGSIAVALSVINVIFVRPRPIPESARMFAVLHQSRVSDGSRFSPSVLREFETYGVFEGVAGQLITRDPRLDLAPNLYLNDTGMPLETAGVTANYFAVMGLPVRGRDFLPAGDDGDVPPAIVSDDLWQREFGGRADAIGKVVSASPSKFRVIGVAPRGFHGPLLGQKIDVWMPYEWLSRLSPRNDIAQGRGDLVLPMINFCRLGPDQTPQQAESAFLAAYGLRHQSIGDLRLVPIHRLYETVDSHLVIVDETTLFVIVAIASFMILAVGCATLTSLTLVHYARRRREFAIRVALGIDRVRLIGQLSQELAPSLIAGFLGAVLVDLMATGTLSRFTLPSGIDLSRVELILDWRVLIAMASLAVSVTSVALLVAVRRFSVRSISTEFVGSATGSLPSSRLRRVVITANVAMSVAVVIVAAVVTRGVTIAFAEAPGFDVAHTLFVEINTKSRFQPIDELTADRRAQQSVNASYDLVAGLERIPSIESVAFGDPPIGAVASKALGAPHTIRTDQYASDLRFWWESASADYLEAVGMRPRLGSAGDRDQVVVSSSLAELLWPDESPLGRSLQSDFGSGTIVGVVDAAFGSVRFGRAAAVISFDKDKRLLATLRNSGTLSIVIKTARPDAIRNAVTNEIRRIFPDALHTHLASGDEIIAQDVGRERLASFFLASFGTVALLLALGGIFGLLSYLAESARADCAVMILLGCTHARVISRNVLSAVVPTSVGILIGICLGAAFSRILEAWLYGATAMQPSIYVATAVLVLAAATAAGYVASFRLRTVTPLEVIRTSLT